ncbi:hypothetical protein ES708_14943 [subsurface metagenome]
MRRQLGLLGKVISRPEIKVEIIEIASQASEKRRRAAEKVSKQMRLSGTVPVCRGYAIYADFNEYMGQKMAQRRLKPTGGGWYHFIIKKALVGAGWECDTAHRPTRFYLPGTESPNFEKETRRDDILKVEDVAANDMTAGT